MVEFFDLDTNEESGAVAIEETAETWVRIDLCCDGLGNDGICLLGVGDEFERISDVAPTAEGARKAILNAAVKARGASIQNCSVGYVLSASAQVTHQSGPKPSR